jgi:serine/threonine-protein kinase
MRLEPGRRLGVYEIVGSLGAGGMGDVYQARDTRLGRLVAIKVVLDELAADHRASDRLTREARLTCRLNHPNIVTVHDVGDVDGHPYIVMEFVDGESLHHAVQRERLPLRRVIEIASDVADGLAVAHAAGIVHRDLKPQNIMLTADGRAKIVDFGVGKTSQSPSGADDPTIQGGGLTDPFFIVGTAGYMAPEQVSGKPIDFRADQFALGVILYELITGQRAFRRDTPVQTMAAILEHELAPLAGLAPRTPIELATVVERCLAKDPAHRYASTQDLARDLRDLRVQLGSAGSRSYAAARPVSRPRWRWAVAIAGLGLAAAGTLLVVREYRTRPDLARSRALLDRFDKRANVDRAIDMLTAAVNASPKDPAVRTMLAEAYVRKFEYTPQDATLAARAGEEAGVALTLNQTSAAAHVVLAMINYAQGRFDGALGEAERAIGLDRKNSRARRERARALMRLGRRDEAEKDFLEAIALDPDDWTSHNGLGALYVSLNRLDAAVDQFERVQSLAPDNVRAYNNLGTAFLRQERFDKAAEMYERSLSLDRNATAYSNLGTALYQQGRYSDAARSFESAVALPGATAVHWFNLGAARYWAPDQREGARAAYETAIKLAEQSRARGSGVDQALLAELASSYAVLALLTTGDEAQRHRAQAHQVMAIIEQPPRDAEGIATLATTYEELGERDQALQWLGAAIKAGYPMKRVERSPWLNELRNDDRYLRLRR